MMPMGKGMGMGGGMMSPEPEEVELSGDAKIDAIRAALKELVDVVGGITVEDAKARKTAPKLMHEEPAVEEE